MLEPCRQYNDLVQPLLILDTMINLSKPQFLYYSIKVIIYTGLDRSRYNE